MKGLVDARPIHASMLMALALLLVVGACAKEDTGDGEMQIEEDTTATLDPIASGEQSYMTYCASCHGREGRGDGPVASVMTTQPADLTQLRAEHGGFPVDSIYAYIDGRADVEAHGTREMPVWGNVWAEKPGGQPVPREEVDMRIRELVEYIRSLQTDGESA